VSRPGKVLVANRGEIALRVIRTLQELGIPSVAVASEADRFAPHALAADACRVLGPAPAAASYLNQEALLEAVRASGAEAVHPGYGFLSENAAFAEALGAVGVTFIGPPASAMRVMGSKTASREAMQRAGVPVVPGSPPGVIDDAGLRKAADGMGYPVLIKASAGGGGKGMRVVRASRDFDAAVTLCRNEAKAAFGDPTVYVEQYLEDPRHIEVQVFGDASGRVFALGERECSVQRRHQKILEESPSPAVDSDLRARLETAAVAAAEAVGYRSAGTVEFLFDARGNFYFLEMNTRLQVEHPVTEMVYGVDLVAAQVLTAGGEPLPFDPDALSPRGHAIEARVYAEDPAAGFLPQTGTVLDLRFPERPGFRVDSGLAPGLEVGVHYDPLLAKLIAWGADRTSATRRLVAGLRDSSILGVTTNLDFLADVLDHPAWEAGELHTGFLDRHFPSWSSGTRLPPEVAAAAALAARNGAREPVGRRPDSPWARLGAWQPALEP